MSPRAQRERLVAVWRQKLQEAEEAYISVFAKTRQIQAELASMPTAEGNLALAKALAAHSQAVSEYARVLQAYTRLILYGERPEEYPMPEPKAQELVTDLDIQEWVFKQHGFAPHPFWIAHCRELYLNAPPEPRSPTKECPAGKRAAIREAFLALGLIRE
jgi:hypothetical protein